MWDQLSYPYMCNNRKGQSSVYSRTPLLWMRDIQIANYQDRLAPSSNSVENSTKPTFLEITGSDQVQYNTVQYNRVIWFLEFQIRHGRKV